MIKNKSKDELIEYVYDLIIESETLKQELRNLKRPNIWQKIKGLLKVNPFYRLKKTKEKMKEFSYEELKDCVIMCNKYESNTIDKNVYKEKFELLTGVKVCKGCSSNPMRLHNDFQRFILGKIKSQEIKGLTIPIVLKSGKYGSEYYKNTIPYTYFEGLYKIINTMKRDYVNLSKKGYNTIHLSEDIETMTEYIESRKNQTLEDKFVEIDTNVEETVEKILFNLEEAVKFRVEDKLSYKEIASKYKKENGKNVSTRFVTTEIKKHMKK